METTKNAVVGEGGQHSQDRINAITRDIEACWKDIEGLPKAGHERTSMLQRVAAMHQIKLALMKQELLLKELGWADAPVSKGATRWGFSNYLAERLGLHKPHEQYGLYGSVLYGIRHMVYAFRRADTMMKAYLETDPVKAKELRLMANVSERDLEMGAAHRDCMRFRGLRMVVVAPLLWLGLMSLKQNSGRNGQNLE